jgi:hypothetical protein
VPFALALDAGQTLTLALTPIDGAVQGRIAMVGLDGATVLGTTDGAAAGQTVLLQTVPVTQAGTYRIDASSIAGIGRYRVSAVLNALIATNANHTQETAQSLTGSFISLGGAATRGAVRGNLDGSNSDWYSFTLNAGEAATLALAYDLHPQSPVVSLELFSADNALIAVGRLDATNVDRFISDFVPTATGTYYARISGTTAGAYSLLLVRGITMQLNSNETGVLQNITQSGLLLGNLGSGNSGSSSTSAGSTLLPVTLVDGSGYRWDIQGSGYIGDGVSDAYDGGMQNTSFPNFFNALTEENGREVVLNAPVAANGIQVTRKVYVPQAQRFARFLEIVTNNSTNTLSQTVPIYTNLGSDGYEPFVMTSSGDASVTTSDNWVITDDTPTGGSSGTAASPTSDPVVTHVVAGEGGRIRPSTFAKNPGEVRYSYDLTLAPGETKIIMHFASMAGNQASALSLAPQLARLELDALVGMSAKERRAVVNFNVVSPDEYLITASAGDTLEITTVTPGSGNGEPVNLLDTKLVLYGPDGVQVAESLNGPDGRNARIRYTVATSGVYRVEVSGENGSGGSYVLSVTGSTISTSAGPRVMHQSTTEGQIVASPPSYLDLTFSEGLRLDTVQASDLVLNGGAVATGMQVIDGRTLRFFIDAQDVEVAYHYSLAAGAIQDLQGENNEAFTGSFAVDHGGPRVISQTPDQTTSAPFNQIDFTFSEGVSAASVSLADVSSFTGPGGSNLLGQISSVTTVGNVVSVRFNSQMTLGQYDLVIGPNISDVVGNAMDQNRNGIKGEGADSYHATVTVRSPDLAVTAINTLNSGAFGQTLDVSWTVKNIGTDPAQQANWYDGIWLSRDNVLGGDDIRLNYLLANANPLPVNGEYTRTAQVSLPVRSDFATGSYFLIVRTDEFGYQAESNENNNTQASGVISLVRPDLDLQVQNLAVGPGAIQSGDTITIRWDDFNSGNAAVSGTYYDRVYLRNTTTGETLLDTSVYSYAAQVAAGQAQARSYSFKLPDGLRGVGNFDIQVTADYYGHIFENNASGTAESNNTAQLGITSTLAIYPDLQIQNLAVDQTAIQSGDTLTIRWNDFNSGSAAVNGAYYNRVYLRNTTTGETLLDTSVYSYAAQVAAGQAQARSYSFKLPDGLRGVGNFDIQVTADYYYNQIFENNASGTAESNNTAQLGITSTLAIYPDLQIQNLAVDQTAIQSGDTLTIRWNDFNSGNALVQSAFYDLLVIKNKTTGEELNKTTVYYDPALSGNGPVAAGQSIARSFVFRLPDGIRGAGNIEISVTADKNGAGLGTVFEVNQTGDAESNNGSSTSIASQIKAYADLRVGAVSAPVAGISGTPMPVSWTVSNNGLANATGDWTDQVVLSRNNLIGDGDDVVVAVVRHTGGLAQGGTYIQNATLTNIQQHYSGRYYLAVRIDAASESYENGTRADNTSLVYPIDLTAAVTDLVLESVVAPTTALSGTSMEVTWVVRNVGNTPTDAPTWVDRVVLSRALTPANDDIIVAGAVPHAGVLGAGQTYTGQARFVVPRDLQGDFYVRVYVNSQRNVTEVGDSTNNTQVTPQSIHIVLSPVADLQLADVSGPAQLSPGQNATVTYTSSNAGQSDANAPWRDRVYIQTTSGLYEVANSWITSNLMAGTSETRSVSFQVPDWMPEGNWHWVVKTDTDNTVYERDYEGNNQAQAADTLFLSQPDLAVTQVTGPGLVTSGNPITVHWQVSNSGNSAQGSWVDQVYLSQNGTATLVKEVSRDGPLGRGESYSASTVLNVPLGFSGPYQLVVVANHWGSSYYAYPRSAIRETNLANNSATGNIVSVVLDAYADLTVSNVTAPLQTIADPATINVIYTVNNTGTGVGRTTQWTDKIVLSTDDILGNADDQVVAESTHEGALDVAQSYTNTVTVQLPAYTSGRYSLFVVADSKNQVFENGHEANNSVTAASKIDVMPKPYADLQIDSVTAQALTGVAASGQMLTPTEN